MITLDSSLMKPETRDAAPRLERRCIDWFEAIEDAPDATMVHPAAVPILLRALDPLGPEEGARLLRKLRELDANVWVVIDLRDVEWCEDHVLARVAVALSLRNPVGSFVGLRCHQVRLLEYLRLGDTARAQPRS